MTVKQTKIDALEETYSTRLGPNIGNYSWFHPDVCLYRQEKQRAMLNLLRKAEINNLADLKILEVGCGFGDNLLNFIILGATPENIYANDIIESRVEKARGRLAQCVHLDVGDASETTLVDNSFDLIFQSTVFSSILSYDMQVELAETMLRLLKKDGCILWYDFLYNNPKNNNVKGCPKGLVKELFPDTRIIFRKVTLAPPLCRSIVRVLPFTYPILNMFSFLRTHLFALIQKE
jgi:ubiquinone/menaquinone biosynthesis C-methylase UbiE